MTISVTVCSTWMRGFTSMKYHSLRVGIDQELDRAGVVVVGFARQLHRGVAQFLANSAARFDRRRDLHHLLMPPLHRAIALVQVQQVAVLVAEDLHFDVPRARQILLQKDGVIAERRCRFALRLFEQLAQAAPRRAPRACRARRRRTRP